MAQEEEERIQLREENLQLREQTSLQQQQIALLSKQGKGQLFLERRTMSEPTPQEPAIKHCLLQDFPGIQIETMEVAASLFLPHT